MKWKNWLVRAVLWLFTRETTRSASARGDRFLIVSTTGLGDTLWGTPAIRALRQTHPEAHIAVLTSEIGYQVLQHNKNIDEIFIVTPPILPSLLRYVRKLKRRKFDAVLVFHSSRRMILPFCALLETPQIIGTKSINKDLDYLLTTPLEAKEQHEIERRLDIVRQVGAHISDYSLEMAVHKEETQDAQRFLDSHGIPSHIPLVGIHPGAKDEFKQWSPEHFIEVGKRLYQNMGCQILVTGNQSEALLVLEIASKIPGAIPIAGELSVPALAALYRKMALLITNDTGPMHLAYAMKTPTVALFGPTDPKLCGPFHVKTTEVIARERTCTPCLKKKCAEPFCLLQIGPDAVYEAALKLYYSKATVSQSSF